ncbi:MAG: tetratricopeptide repeat protein [Bacteroidales bacterium]|nr:tetratricopeptide repeat protein [Bacteroidales bacterium]
MRKIAYTLLWALFVLIFCPAGLSGQDLPKQTDLFKSDSCIIEAQRAYNYHDAEKVRSLCRQALQYNPANDAAFYLMAKVDLVENKLQPAEMNLRQAVALDSNNYYYAATLGAVYMQNTDVTEAIRIFEKLVNKYPTKRDPYTNLINIYLPRGQQDRAMVLADRLEKAVGPNDISTMTRFKIYSGQNDAQKAIEVLEEADARTPSELYETYIAELLESQGKDSLAIVYYDKALRNDPQCIPALFGKMEVYRRNGNHALYLGYLKSFLENPEVDPSIKKQHVESVMELPVYKQRYAKEMSKCLDALSRAHPSDSSIAISSAMFMARSGESELAMNALERTLKYYPTDYYIRSNIISFLYSREDWPRLELFTDSTMAVVPEQNKDLFQFKGIAQYNQGKLDQAIETLLSQEKNLRKEKDTATLLQIYSFVGDIYHQKNDNKSAYKFYKKALKMDPRNAPVLNNYAWYMATGTPRGDLNKALQMSKITVDDNPSESTYLDTYGWILYLMGEKEQAKKYLQQAVAFDGGESTVLMEHYADVLYDLQEFDLAFIYYEKALKRALDNTLESKESLDELEKLSEKVNARKKAREEK